MTLVSAPAGFGKTTLVSEWLASNEWASAWLSLDERDGNPARFLTYLVAALQTITADIGAAALDMLQSPQPPTESVLTVLLNEIASIPDRFVLVLDDYHAIDAAPVDRALAFLLDHLPSRMHLVIATREDPQLPLARLRAQNQLTELRAADLRFTPGEAAAFLNQGMRLNLSAEEISLLENRTEGWIVGLQLAALSMRGRDDVHGFIRAFAGDNRYVVDYLVEEVLQRQPEWVRSFLLHTSILDRLSGSLCDAVTGQENGGALLETLERSNLFVVPLDDKRHWFRYHQLFADVLQANLLKEQPEQRAVLHRRASEWYENKESPADAIRHAIAAEDFRRAAALVERAWHAMDRSFQTVAWISWVKMLPDELIRAMPVLSAAYAWALLEVGNLEAADDYLRSAERWLGVPADASAAGMIVVDEGQFQALPVAIASARAYYAQTLGDVLGTVMHGLRALDLLPEDDHLQRGIVAALLGVAYWTSGDLEAAHRTLSDGMAWMRRAGNILFSIRGTYALADIRMAQGRLREAIRTYEQSLQLATEHGDHVLRGTADLYLRLSELYREQDSVSAAAQYLLKSEALGEQAASPHWQYRLRLAQARIKEIEGDLDDALNLLDEAERRYVPTPVPDVRPIGALRAQVWVAQGKLTEALDWVRARRLSPDDELSYLREFEHVTLARVLIACCRHDQVGCSLHDAVRLLDRLLKAAEEQGRMGSAIKILTLQALAQEAEGSTRRALVPLERALALAEPEGYIRMFVDEGVSMARLLSQAADQGIMPDYIKRLLAAVESRKPVYPGEAPLHPTRSAQPLIEPLSQRELEVLRLIDQGLSNREIGERLFLALSTVKGHNRVLFDKLQVQRRTEALARARELGLL